MPATQHHKRPASESETAKLSRGSLLAHGVLIAAIVAVPIIGYLQISGCIWAASEDAKLQKSVNLDFSFDKLRSSERPAEYPDIGEITWLDDHTLRVSVVIAANHGAVRWHGNYGVADNHLRLRYITLLNELLACGWRPVRLTYVIRDVPRLDYVVTVEETGRLVRDW